MLSSRLLIRLIQQKHSKFITTQTLNRALSSSSSSDSSSSDDEKKSNKKKSKLTAKPSSETSSPNKAKSEEALKKLNMLLKRMIEEDKQEVPKDTSVQLARPNGRSKANKNVETDRNIVLAAKNVAKSLGGSDIKQTESELLNKLLNPTLTQTSGQDESKSLNLSDVLAGMKIDRSVQPENTTVTSKAYRVRQAIQGKNHEKPSYQQRRQEFQMKKPFIPENIEKIDLFGTDPLGIFTNKDINYKQNPTELKTWDVLHQRELELAITHPPDNYYQEMILWTKQGKVWTFPIDNETGMEEEKNVYFADHIFLEKHLEPWCPQRGPIRHFMELVCVGLSKNPYLTVQAKKEHIEWFQNYFMSKENYLKEIGAMPVEAKVEEIK